MPRYDVPKAAPDPLRLVQSFVNTVDLENRIDWLATPDDLGQWFRERGITPTTRGASGLRRAHALRDAFRTLLIANRDGVPPPDEAIGVVNASARGLTVSLTSDLGIGFTAKERAGGDLATLAGIALDAILDGSWVRLKACRNCRWSFYDYSTNRTAHWCSMSLCGNRLKTRNYRRRRR